MKTQGPDAPGSIAGAQDAASLAAERDLYRALLDLAAHEDLGPYLEEALALVARACSAQKGFLALWEPEARDPYFAVAQGVSDGEVGAIRAEISAGIVAAALRAGRTVSTASAVEDPRFAGQRSVQAGRIRAVLCVPLGSAPRPAGVLYLAGRASPGPFTARDQALAERAALHAAPFAVALAKKGATKGAADHTAELRAKLRADAVAGTSRALAEALRMVSVAAAVDVTVLLTGESGTGKTELARVLHDSSLRARGPFVELNCAAIPEALFESELFGAEKGAHSTATKKIPGKVAAAKGGTLLLDEVAEIPLSSQARLLQFLQSKRYFPLGADAPVDADVRVLAATNANLEERVRERTFREDLYYRLEVLTVRVPPLRDRLDDVEPIALRAAERASAASGLAPLRLSTAALAALRDAPWPGNVRQLSAAVQRGVAFAHADGRAVIEPHDLFPEKGAGAGASAAAEALSYQEATRRYQRKLLSDALDAAQGNASEAARRLDLARSHFYELMKAHGLSRSSGRG